MSDNRMRPRWLVKLLANLNGYFWLPCPICGEPFAGFEWEHGNGHTLMIDDSRGTGVCPKGECVEETFNRNVARVSAKETK